MSAADAGFLYLERPHAPLHIGAIAILDGELRVDELVKRIEARLPRLRRYTQRAMEVPLGAEHPRWEDDPDSDVRDHVYRWVLPAPGGEAELLEICAELHARPLDRSRPLWEMHVLEGLAGERTALFQKVHHCMIDGASGAQLLEELLDPPAGGQTACAQPLPPPVRRPSSVARLGSGLADATRRQLRTAGTVLGALMGPQRARASAQQLWDAVSAALRLAVRDMPELPWNAPLGQRRRLAFTRLPMAGVSEIRKRHGCTVNDVVLSVLAGGLHRYLRGMGHETEDVEVRALVPVNLRAPHEKQALGNRISAMIVPLAVAFSEELPRLHTTRAITERLKERMAWTGIATLLAILEGVPAPLVGLAGRAVTSLGRLANVVATNIPGPRDARRLCGSRLDALYPIIPIADGIGLGLAVFSYNGWLHVGLNADADLVPDLEKLRLGIEESFTQLLGSA